MAAEVPYQYKPDILIVESTYGVQNHPPKEERERRFTGTSFVPSVPPSFPPRFFQSHEGILIFCLLSCVHDSEVHQHSSTHPSLPPSLPSPLPPSP